MKAADALFEAINYNAIRASLRLAQEKGRYAYFEGSDWQTGDIEVISAKADKGIAIRKAADQLGIDPAQILGIGDSVNDLPMFEGCGLRVAMGNAVEPVKARADYITLTNDEDGVGEALRQLVQ